LKWYQRDINLPTKYLVLSRKRKIPLRILVEEVFLFTIVEEEDEDGLGCLTWDVQGARVTNFCHF